MFELTPRPYNPRIELDGALAQGHLRHAISLAAEVAADAGRALDLQTAARFLPLVARENPGDYDAWALRWLARWAREAGASIKDAADVAALLEELPHEPGAVAELGRLLR